MPQRISVHPALEPVVLNAVVRHPRFAQGVHSAYYERLRLALRLDPSLSAYPTAKEALLRRIQQDLAGPDSFVSEAVRQVLDSSEATARLGRLTGASWFSSIRSAAKKFGGPPPSFLSQEHVIARSLGFRFLSSFSGSNFEHPIGLKAHFRLLEHAGAESQNRILDLTFFHPDLTGPTRDYINQVLLPKLDTLSHGITELRLRHDDAHRSLEGQGLVSGAPL